MSERNDIDYGRYMDAQRPPESEDVDHSAEDSDASAGPSHRRKGGAKAAKSRGGPKVRTLNRWTAEEHEKLAYLVAKWGSEKNWAKVAEEMNGRTGKQCRERWLNHMKPGIIKGNWSFEEEFLLAQCHAVVGSHWSKMTKRLPGRTENSIKNFWNATLRSKAPHKRRGILWLYMQQQTCQDGENVDAFLVAVARLYESQELPTFWAELMESGRLTERTLRSVLRAEKEFLENPDCELHPLALPHPSHGQQGTSDTGAAAAAPPAAAAPTAAARAPPPPAPLLDAVEAAAAAEEAEPDCEAESAAAAPSSTQPRADGGVAAAPSSCRPPSSPPAAGLTPRFPEAGAAAAHNGSALCPAAFQASAAMAGLCLPPEVVAALSAHEVWSSLPSTRARNAAFNAAPGSMEPLMPALGLASDLHPTAADGAFGGNAAAHDAIWTCLPSLRGLGNAAYGGPAPGAHTPHVAADPLKLLEPFGALHAHRSSSNSVQTRPDSALELERPAAARQQPGMVACTDSQEQLSRDSCSRPGSSMDQMPAGAAASRGWNALAYHHHQQQRAFAGAHQQQQYSGEDSPPTDDVYPNYHQAAAAGYSAHAQQHAWTAPERYSADASMHAAAAAGYGVSWGSHYQQSHQQQQDDDDRGDSPTESAEHSGPAYGGSAGHPSSSYAAWGQAGQGYGSAPEAHPSAVPAPLSRLQQQQSSASSPFARHANTTWDAAGPAANAPAAHGPGSMRPPAAPGQGWAAQQQQQQQGHARQHLHLAAVPGSAAAAALFSPRSVDSPMTGALQHLLDSAAAHAGLRAQDICAWLAAANAGQGAAQDAERAPAEEQQQPQHRDWLAGEFAAAMQQQQQQQQQHQPVRAHSVSQIGTSAQDNSGNHNNHSSSTGVQDPPSFACSILEALLGGPRQSAQLGDMLVSPAGMSCTAALLQGALPPTPAAAAAATAALQAAVVGVKRERSLPDAQEDADLLIEQPGIKLPRVF